MHMAQASSSEQKGKKQSKGSKQAGKQVSTGVNKAGNKTAKAKPKGKCFHCGEVEDYKRNYLKYLDFKRQGKDSSFLIYYFGFLYF